MTFRRKPSSYTHRTQAAAIPACPTIGRSATHVVKIQQRAVARFPKSAYVAQDSQTREAGGDKSYRDQDQFTTGFTSRIAGGASIDWEIASDYGYRSCGDLDIAPRNCLQRNLKKRVCGAIM
jgi:hypothetical protein